MCKILLLFINIFYFTPLVFSQNDTVFNSEYKKAQQQELLLQSFLNKADENTKHSDSLFFINEVKLFALKEIGTVLSGDIYNKWAKDETPFLYLYISKPDKIEKPEDMDSPYIFCGHDTNKAKEKELEYANKGFVTFFYKTYATSATMLNARLLSYSKEALAFIVFHELTHNFITQQKIKIPYEFNEAMADIAGNYGSLKYSRTSSRNSVKAAKIQINNNEKIYGLLNNYISKINNKQHDVSELNSQCGKKIRKILKYCNTFQKDRFDYNVNNAYLLKNQYYCKYYFLLKKVFLKQKSIEVYLDLMKIMPENAAEIEILLHKFE